MTDLCLLDMDGVLADFNAGAHAAHHRPNIYLEDPSALGRFDIEKCWGITAEEFWKPCRGYDFWRNLAKMPEADELVDLLTSRFGVENIAILTSPAEDEECIPAKKAWMREYFPQLAKNMIFGGAKQFLAAPNHYLVDDRDKNLEKFYEADGNVVIVPRLWNSAYHHADHVIDTIKLQLEDLTSVWQN